MSRYSSQLAGFVAAGFAYLLIARFYKWYAWLFPLLNLLALHGYLNAPATAVPAAGALGLVDRRAAGRRLAVPLGFGHQRYAGFAAGDRPDRMANATPRAVANPGASGPARCRLCRAAFHLVWLPGGVGGWQAIPNYLAMLVDGSRGVVRSMAMDLPQFQRRALLAEPSLIIIAYFMVPATYVLCLLDSLWAEYRGRPTAASRFLLLVALIGLSTLHQTLHRRGPESSHPGDSAGNYRRTPVFLPVSGEPVAEQPATLGREPFASLA